MNINITIFKQNLFFKKKKKSKSSIRAEAALSMISKTKFLFFPALTLKLLENGKKKKKNSIED